MPALPLLPEGAPSPVTFPPVRPLILQVSTPPGSSKLEEFFYGPSPDVTHGSFAAVRTFFLAKGHAVAILKCPDLDAFLAAALGPSSAQFPASLFLSSPRVVSLHYVKPLDH